MRSIRNIAFASVSLLAISTPAFAQDAPEEDGFSATEIIVEARRKDESLQDVPLVVNAVTSEAVEKLNLRRFEDITAVVPGLSMATNANGIGTTSSVRGVNYDVNLSGNNGTIEYYLNDSPIPSNILFSAMYDIGQIEVLRGPQGTLRGRATPSGSITVTSHRPNLSEMGGYFNATVASADTLNAHGAINLPIINDVLAIRVAALAERNQADRVTSVNVPGNPWSRTRSGRVSVRFEPTNWIDVNFMYQKLVRNSQTFDQVQSFSNVGAAFTPDAAAPNYGVILPEDRLSVAGSARTTRQEYDTFTWSAGASFAGQRLNYAGSYNKMDLLSFDPADGSNFYAPLTPGMDTHSWSTRESHEVRLQNEERLFGMVDYVIGYFRDSLSAPTDLTTASLIQIYAAANLGGGAYLPGCPLPSGFTTSFACPLGGARVQNTPVSLRAKTKEESFYGNLTVHLGESTEIAGGIRRISYDNDANLRLNGVIQPGATELKHFNATVYNVALRHRLNENLMVYASTGSSWRPGAFAKGNFSQSYTPVERAHLQLEPETSKSYEIGFKSDWFDRTVRLNVSYYHQDYENYPLRAPGAGIYYININSSGIPERGQFNFGSAVPVKVDGVEAELAWNPSRRFNLSATLNWSKGTIGNAMLACTDALINSSGLVGQDGIPDLVAPTLAQMQAAYGSEHLAECPGGGLRAAFAPDWSGSVIAEYSLPVSDGADAYLRGLLSWKGSSQNNPTNLYDDVDSYGLVNLFTGIRANDGAWEVSLFAKNIANVTRIVSLNDTPLSTAVTNVYMNVATLQSTSPQVLGTTSTTRIGRYSGVTVTAPREFGINFRMAFGSR